MTAFTPGIPVAFVVDGDLVSTLWRLLGEWPLNLCFDRLSIESSLTNTADYKVGVPPHGIQMAQQIK
jgi:hypothetical protein